MIRTEDAALLESDHAAVVGTVDAAGLADATRAWGTWFVDGRLRCLLPADAHRTLGNLRANGRIAVCMTHVLDLQSVQVKGRVVGAAEPATAEDLDRHGRYWAGLLEHVHRAEGTTAEQLRAMTPDALVAVEIAVDLVFDATPGPNAGAER